MTPRKIYIASSWKNRYMLREIKDELIKRGHKVTSGWLDVGEVDYPAEEGAERDINDLDEANVLLFYPDNVEEKTSGKFVEFGYALAAGHEIYIVKPETTTCIFINYRRPWIKYFNSFEEVYPALEN